MVTQFGCFIACLLISVHLFVVYFPLLFVSQTIEWSKKVEAVELSNFPYSFDLCRVGTVSDTREDSWEKT